MKDRLLAITVLLAGVALAVGSPPAIAAVALGLPLIGVITGPRLRLDRVAQVGLTIGAMVLGVLAPRLLVGPEIAVLDDPTRLGERALLLAMPMLAVAAARALVHAPAFGARLTLTAALVALTAAGRALTGLTYPLIAGAAVITGLAALHASDPVLPRMRLLGARHAAAGLFGVAVAAGLAVTSAWALPRLHDAAIARFLARYNRSRSGFSDQMYLGDLHGLLASDTVVMRVRGGAPPLLRGTVFTTYTGGRWETEAFTGGIEVVETPAEPAHPRGLIEIEQARRGPRYFLPLGARDLVVGTGVYQRDVLGLFRPAPRFEAKRLWFAEGGGPPPVPPRPADEQIPRRLRAPLGDLLAVWGVTQASPRARVDAIADRLRADYRYSLDYERSHGADPVLDFLMSTREGHCEYFASAFTLLARAAGVPARLAAGYRLTETSPLGYGVVRERNAHSWSEAWIDGRWMEIDPTPVAEMNAASPATTPLVAALLDGIATAWEQVDDWLGRRSAFEMSLILVGLVALLLAARVLRSSSRAARRATSIDAPLPGFAALSRALAARGVGRSPNETLATYARRVEREVELSPPQRALAAELVRRYELCRYAGGGDPGALDGELTLAARALAKGL